MISYALFKESALSLFEKSKLKKVVSVFEIFVFINDQGLMDCRCPAEDSGRERNCGPNDISDITSDLISRDSEKERGKMNKR